ncbi:predicted protein [Lichtheimia corymbifera JMRC:FSU:9682]|uniref:Uncharacterized protein n=1 Tax=Lichtheimia corymbifera JMRC:FSU:9682 TaxID=1263082 RepID=A0A068RQT2_9FUNG|nr:predicted protein [Lichtheimia corymbifera JMRC:FSU:9682]
MQQQFLPPCIHRLKKEAHHGDMNVKTNNKVSSPTCRRILSCPESPWQPSSLSTTRAALAIQAYTIGANHTHIYSNIVMSCIWDDT